MENPKIIFEDKEILVLEKPPNLPVVKAESVKIATLQDWLETYFNLDGSLGVGSRAGIVHRLDKDTSGIILVAKSQESFEFLQAQFAERRVKKTYITLSHGIPNPSAGGKTFSVNLSISRHKFGKFGVDSRGKTAVTNFSVVKKLEFGKEFSQLTKDLGKNWKRYFESNARLYSLLEASPETGRTHQIRVHLKSLRLPIVSDPLYNPRKLAKFDEKFCPRMFLHASKITFCHPVSQKLVTFEAALPNDLLKALQYLKDLNDN